MKVCIVLAIPLFSKHEKPYSINIMNNWTYDKQVNNNNNLKLCKQI